MTIIITNDVTAVVQHTNGLAVGDKVFMGYLQGPGRDQINVSCRASAIVDTVSDGIVSLRDHKMFDEGDVFEVAGPSVTSAVIAKAYP